MTRDYSQETSAGGGGKKFLYSGARKRNAFDDDDIDAQKWTYNNHIPGTQPVTSTSRDKGGDFDVEGIWSIKTNIGISSKPVVQLPGVQEGWDRGSKGFYSRHGGPTGGNPESSTMTNGIQDPSTDGENVARIRYPSGKTWPRAYNAYSYTSPSGGHPQQPTGATTDFSKDYQAVSPRQPGSGPIHSVTSPVNVSAGGNVGFRGSARNSVQRRGPGHQTPQAKHFDF